MRTSRCRRLVTQGIVNGPDGRKMSKRWGNVVAPGPMVARFGADTVRMFMLFAAPPEKDIDWSDEQVDGLFRFLVARLAHLPRAAGVLPRARGGAHRGARRLPRAPPQDAPNREAGDGRARGRPQVQHEHRRPDGARERALRARAPGRSRARRRARGAPRRRDAARPFAPHAAEELWHEVLGPSARERLLAEEPWPAFDPALVVADMVTIAVQVNGKLRGEVQAPIAAGEAEVRALAEGEHRVRAHLDGKTVRKVVFVPKRLINFVVA